MSKSRTVFYVGLKYFLFFLLFYLLHSAQIEGVRPFAFGMLFALVWCNQKIYILAPLYVLSGLLIEFTLNNIICLFCTVIVFGGFYFLHYKLKKPLNHILIGIYAFLSQFAFIYLSLGNTEQMIKAIITLIVGIICLYAYLFFMQSEDYLRLVYWLNVISIVTLAPTVAVIIRRVHDFGKSGWWLFVPTPRIILFGFVKGDDGSNAFGAPE